MAGGLPSKFLGGSPSKVAGAAGSGWDWRLFFSLRPTGSPGSCWGRDTGRPGAHPRARGFPASCWKAVGARRPEVTMQKGVGAGKIEAGRVLGWAGLLMGRMYYDQMYSSITGPRLLFWDRCSCVQLICIHGMEKGWFALGNKLNHMTNICGSYSSDLLKAYAHFHQ